MINKKNQKLVEINLVPEIKYELLVARSNRDRILSWSIVISAVVLTIVLILVIVVFLAQAIVISNQKQQIKDGFDKYSRYEGVNELLTIQNQLSNLKSIHDKKPITSRLFDVLSSTIVRNQLNIKLNKIELNPHDNKVVVEAYSEAGYQELERLQKTIQETRVAYIDKQDYNQVKDQETQEAAPEAELNKSIEQKAQAAGFANLTGVVSPLIDPSLGNNSEGKKVLSFKIGFTIHQDFFKNTDKIVFIEGATYKDVTDSNLSISSGLFAPKVETRQEEDDSKKEPADKQKTNTQKAGGGND